MRKIHTSHNRRNIKICTNEIPTSFIQVREYLDSPTLYVSGLNSPINRCKYNTDCKNRQNFRNLTRNKKQRTHKPILSDKKNISKGIETFQNSLLIEGQKSVLTPQKKLSGWAIKYQVNKIQKKGSCFNKSSRLFHQNPCSNPITPTKSPQGFLYGTSKKLRRRLRLHSKISKHPKECLSNNDVSVLSHDTSEEMLPAGQIHKRNGSNAVIKVPATGAKTSLGRPHKISLKQPKTKTNSRSNLLSRSSKFFVRSDSVEHPEISNSIPPVDNEQIEDITKEVQGVFVASQASRLCPKKQPKKYHNNTNVKLVFKDKLLQKKFGSLERKVNQILVKNSKARRRCDSIELLNQGPEQKEDFVEQKLETSKNIVTKIQTITTHKSKTRCRIKMSTSKMYSEVSYSSRNDVPLESCSMKRNSDLEIVQTQCQEKAVESITPIFKGPNTIILDPAVREREGIYNHPKFRQASKLKSLLNSKIDMISEEQEQHRPIYPYLKSKLSKNKKGKIVIKKEKYAGLIKNSYHLFSPLRKP
ncbi:unnamed protein product [Moneuplotes crassus]|uniref:Uncharacterized protein n=1 Tax=Euplotes crassus TaxID=5936 RepID=A0AAD1U1K4_EUPCR|nr:unnamed protein product [Moneuplotes crassus]